MFVPARETDATKSGKAFVAIVGSARLLLLMLVACWAGPGVVLAEGSSPRSLDALFTLIGDFPLGTATSRTDYQSIDPAAHRLYIAKMGDGKLLVYDLAQDRLVREIAGLPKVTGVLAVPRLHRLYASVPGAGVGSSIRVGLGMLGLSAGNGMVAIFDSETLKELARLPGGVFPDGIAYDPVEQRIFVSDELGSAISVIDAQTNHQLARIKTAGEVGNVQFDRSTKRIYAPLQTRNALAVIDPAKNILVAQTALSGCEHPHGLVIAPDAALGYVACDGNDVLLVVNLETERIICSRPLAHDPDVLAMDPETKRLYVASESGGLSTFDATNPQFPVALGDVFVGDDAHALAVDPTSHRLYFALANHNGRAVLRVLAPRNSSAH
jgi:DNA-binding beta-propeller fold protein YncE